MSTGLIELTGERINAQLSTELRQARAEIERLRNNERALQASVWDLQQAIRKITASFTRESYVEELRQMVQDAQQTH